jgi:hypothetical protein
MTGRGINRRDRGDRRVESNREQSDSVSATSARSAVNLLSGDGINRGDRRDRRGESDQKQFDFVSAILAHSAVNFLVLG